MIRIVGWRGIKLTLGICSMTLLYGCGGGGGEGNNPPPPTGLNAPTATNACITTGANAVHTGVLPASDPDGQPLVFNILSQPTKGMLATDAAGNYRYTPNTGVRGMDQFTFRARDSTGRESGIATVTFLIEGAIRIMPLGDSITEGTTVGAQDLPPPGQRVSYRQKLYNDLVATANGRYNIDFVGSLREGQDTGIDPDHEGWGGAGANDIANGNSARQPPLPGVYDLLTANPPDVVLLHIGTNDLSNNPGTSASAVGAILDNIERWERDNYPLWVFVTRIIQRLDGIDVTPFNDGISSLVASRGNNRFVVVNQQTGAGLNYPPAPATSGGDMADSLHPNQSGYDKMASRWRSDLLTANALPVCP